MESDDALSLMAGLFVGLGGLIVADYLLWTSGGLIAGARRI